jgi:hypothetical protein
MKRLLYLLILISLPVLAIGQQQQERFERIRALKVSYITEQLKLSSDQAARFWPVYNKYEDEVRTVRRSLVARYKEMNAGASREQARKFIEDNLEYQSQVLELKKKYKDELLKTISPQQLARLYEAEREFKKMLIRQLREEEKK